MNKAPVSQVNMDQHAPCLGVAGVMIWCCGIGKDDYNEKKWEVLMNTVLASSHNGMTNSQLAPSAQNESYWV